MQTWKVIVSYFRASGFCVEYEMYVYFAERLWHNAGTVRFIYFCPYRAEVDVSNILFFVYALLGCIENRWRNGLKAQNSIAQGNALGFVWMQQCAL